MDEAQATRLVFDLFESSGIGLVGLDADGVIVEANRNVGVYLGVEPAEILGQRMAVLRPAIRSEEFWSAFPATFYCLAPGPNNLLLIVSRRLGDAHGGRLARAVIMRPYSLEREFARMRVSLNNFLAHEVASRLNSIGIASEFIGDPELRESQKTRQAFIATFRHDVEELNSLFVALLETAEQLSLANRIAHAPVDWRALLEDLVAKVRGLASERSATISCILPPHLPSPSGDYHWLYLGLYGVLTHALRTAPALTELSVEARATAGGVETLISASRGEDTPHAAWPPSALFLLDEAHPRIGRLEIEDVAVTRAIFLLHGGELLAVNAADRVEYIVSLPA